MSCDYLLGGPDGPNGHADFVPSSGGRERHPPTTISSHGNRHWVEDHERHGRPGRWTRGLELAEPVQVAVPGSHLEMVRSALGCDARRIRLVDMGTAGRDPGRIIPTVLYGFAREHATGRVRIVTEPLWPGRTSAEYRAAPQHEALINIAMSDQEATILCPYDTQGLDDAALANARRTHPPDPGRR